MNRWGAAIAISQSITRIGNRHSSCCRALFVAFGRRSSSSLSPNDDLDGLIDCSVSSVPESGFSYQEKQRESMLSVNDIAFLQEEVGLPCSVLCQEATMILDGIRDNGNDFGDNTQKFLRQFRGKLSEPLVLEVIKLLHDPSTAVGFFKWAGRQIGFSHTDKTYNVLLDVLGCGGSNKVLLQSLKEIGEDDREVLGKLLNYLVLKWCKTGNWNGALEELGRLKDLGYRPTRATYNALVQVFLTADKMDSALSVHREMMDSNHTMDRYTMGCFVSALCRLGRWEEALSMMEKAEFSPDTNVYNKMIAGLMEASLFEEAMSFLHRMRSNLCHPNAVTYNTLLSGFLRKKQLGWCKRIVNMMITEGCNPSLPLFNSLIHAYCAGKDHAYAYKLLKKMVECSVKPGYATYNILIGGVCGFEDFPTPDSMLIAEKAYEEMMEAGFVLNKVNVGNFARCLCGFSKFSKAFEVIKQLMDKGFIPDTGTYTNVIKFLCQANEVEKALLLFEEMKRNHILPSVYTYTILIDNFCKVGLLQQARIWFDEMVREGCSPNVVTYTSLIHAYLKARKLDKADEVFEAMIKAGCQPNIITYSALVDGLCKAGQLEKACQIYAKMLGSAEQSDASMYFQGTCSGSTEPNVFTYGALINGLCKAHKVIEASDLLEIMTNSGCEPNDVVCDALIDGLCKAGKLEEAQVLLARMSERGYAPNVYTYSSLIDKLFKDKRLDLAMKALSKMLESSCAPNVVTYTEMIDGLCKVQKTEEAYKLLMMMEEKGCIPNVVTYTAMIDGFGKAGKVEKCLELLRVMTAKKCAPNFVTYRVLIDHCCAASLLDEAHGLLEEMKQTYWPSSLAGYCNIIQGFSKDFLVSHGLVEEISWDGPELIIPSYCILVDSLSKAGRLERAVDLYKELLIQSLSHVSAKTKKTSSSLIESLCTACQVEKAFELYSFMEKKGDIPELHVLFYLVKGLIKKDKWAEALQLSHLIYQKGTR